MTEGRLKESRIRQEINKLIGFSGYGERIEKGIGMIGHQDGGIVKPKSVPVDVFLGRVKYPQGKPDNYFQELIKTIQ